MLKSLTTYINNIVLNNLYQSLISTIIYFKDEKIYLSTEFNIKSYNIRNIIFEKLHKRILKNDRRVLKIVKDK